MILIDLLSEEKNKEKNNNYSRIIHYLKLISCNESGKNISFKERKFLKNLKWNSFEEPSIFIGSESSIIEEISPSFLEINNRNCIILFDATYKKATELINLGFNPRQIFIVCTRSFSKNDLSFLKEKNVNLFSYKDIFMNLEEESDDLIEMTRQFSLVHVSVNLNVLDPAFAPLIFNPEPGGLSFRDLIYLLQRIRLLNPPVIEICGIGEGNDPSESTFKLIAKAVSEMQ
ncbi:MAG: arginase family protein [archaeon]